MHISGVHRHDGHEGHDDHESHEESRKKRSISRSTHHKQLMSNIRKERSIQTNNNHAEHDKVKVKFNIIILI